MKLSIYYVYWLLTMANTTIFFLAKLITVCVEVFGSVEKILATINLHVIVK